VVFSYGRRGEGKLEGEKREEKCKRLSVGGDEGVQQTMVKSKA
jgi:hypothetical protein